MTYVIKVLKRLFKLGPFDFLKVIIKRLRDIIFLDYLTSNLVKKSHNIRVPLILISQIQRSGGTLVSQLFDGHSQIYAYPNELTIWKPKWKLKNLSKKFENLDNEYIKHFALKSEYKKESKSKWNKTYNFFFNLNAQKKIFNFNVNKKSSQRDILNAYFSSFFSSWINYKGSLFKKKYITAFIPRVNLEKESIKYFFKNYPDGRLITIVRDPLDWLASASKHDPKTYGNFETALNLWKKSTESSIFLIKNNNVIGLTFYDLVKNTKKTINYICKKIQLDIKDILYVPTFNSEPIMSDSSFKAIEGKIDQKTLNRKKKFSNEKKLKSIKIKKLLNNCRKLYSEYYRLTKIR